MSNDGALLGSSHYILTSTPKSVVYITQLPSIRVFLITNYWNDLKRTILNNYKFYNTLFP